jgi:hypothetical protein
MDTQINPIFWLIGWMLIMGLSIWLMGGNDRKAVETWMRKQGYTLVDFQRGALQSGPFFPSTRRRARVYTVRVHNAQGQQRFAWVRCSTPLLGASIEVRWEP